MFIWNALLCNQPGWFDCVKINRALVLFRSQRRIKKHPPSVCEAASEWAANVLLWSFLLTKWAVYFTYDFLSFSESIPQKQTVWGFTFLLASTQHIVHVMYILTHRQQHISSSSLRWPFTHLQIVLVHCLLPVCLLSCFFFLWHAESCIDEPYQEYSVIWFISSNHVVQFETLNVNQC